MAVGCRRGSVERQVLEAVKPGPEDYEAAGRAVEEALRLAYRALAAAGYQGFELRVEGSYAKDTWLRGELDIDLFALFDRDICIGVAESFAERLLPVLASLGVPVEVRYAQHPYLRLLVEGFWVELVPGCKPGGKVLTPVDRTPLHTNYVRSRLTPEMRDEVRLLKSFTKGVGVYGAELAVGGFSGYLLELLVARYQCFRSVLEAAATQWRPPVMISVEGLDPAPLRRRYPDSVMFVPDPVDPERNVAAAVRPRSLATFVLAARSYLEGPSPRFFHVYRGDERVQPHAMDGALEGLLLARLVFSSADSPDNMWGVVARVARLAEAVLEENGFTVARVEHIYVDELLEGAVAVVLETPPGRSLVLHVGPPVWDRVNVERFMQGLRRRGRRFVGPWIDGEGRLRVLVEPRARDAVELLARLLLSRLPGSARRRLGSLEFYRGLEALWRAESLDPRWAAGLARGRPSWLRLG